MKRNATLSVLGLTFLIGCASAEKAWKQENTVMMPECSIGVARLTAETGYKELLPKNRNEAPVEIRTPFDQIEVFRDIANVSCNRLRNKLTALGYNVTTEKTDALRAQYFTENAEVRGPYVYFGFSETGFAKGGAGFGLAMAYGDIVRHQPGILIVPNFNVFFGALKETKESDQKVPRVPTRKKSRGQARIKTYSPQVTVSKAGSGVLFLKGDQRAQIELEADLSDDSIPWLKKLEPAMYSGKTGLQDPIPAGVLVYTMSVDPLKMKQAILLQLDRAENELIGQIKAFRNQ